MVFVPFFITLALLCISVWMWHLSQAQIEKLAVYKYDRARALAIVQESTRSQNVDTLKEIISGLEGFVFHAEHDPRTAIYFGTLSFPKQVFEGDSLNISLIVDQQSFKAGLLPEICKTEDTASDKQVFLNIQEKDSAEQFLEVELLAAALDIAGENKQKKSLTLKTLAYQWNCQFKSAGKHEICLVLNVIHPSGERYIGSINQLIRVWKFDHATQRQFQIGAAVTGVAGLLLGIATTLGNLLK